jgi:plasmid stabilization system protein ParE
MTWTIERTRQSNRDLAELHRYLVRTHKKFGSDTRQAVHRADARIRKIETSMLSLARAPRQGTLRLHLGEGIRSVTKDRAVIYFELDEPVAAVRVLAIFYGGQDHQRAMLERLLNEQP